MKYKMALVGEAWGEKEEDQGLPFVGPTGWLLTQLLSQVGLARDELFITNVFNLRPQPNNDVTNLCGPARDGIPGLPALQKGKFVRAEYAKELDRLYNEIDKINPNIIVALGATAAWAFLHTSGIKAIRGAVAKTAPAVTQRLCRSYKVLPTYHPSAVSRQWELRPVILSDLDKAKREQEFPDVRRPQREIWIEPTLLDLATYEREYIKPAHRLSVDIETASQQITCIGFSPDPSTAIVIPFYSERSKSYWPTIAEELAAWDYVRRWCQKPCLFQNGMYDMQFLWRSYGIPCNAAEDTMLLHHAFQPEMEKGLGFLGTIYTDEASWKHMRKGMKHD